MIRVEFRQKETGEVTTEIGVQTMLDILASAAAGRIEGRVTLKLLRGGEWDMTLRDVEEVIEDER